MARYGSAHGATPEPLHHLPSEAIRLMARVARYRDGSPVREGDKIRYHQAPGGMLPHGDWQYGVAVHLDDETRQKYAKWNPTGRYGDTFDPERLYLLDTELSETSGWPRMFDIAGHVVERA